MDKFCKCGCGDKLIKRSDENNTHFKQRKFFNQSHANSFTQGDKNRARVKDSSVDTVKQEIINNWMRSWCNQEIPTRSQAKWRSMIITTR